MSLNTFTARWELARNVVITLVGAIALLVVAALAAQRIANILLIILMAAVVAYMAAPAIAFLKRHLRLPRVLATAVVYLGVLAAVFFGGRLLAQSITPELSQLPRAFNRLTANIDELALSYGQAAPFANGVNGLLPANIGATAAPISLEAAKFVTDAVINIILTLVLSIYLLNGGPQLIRALHRVTPSVHRAKVGFLEDNLTHVVGGYIRGQLTMGLVIGATTGIALTLFGVRFALIVGIMAFFLALIPIVGTILTGVIACAAASLNGVPTLIGVLVFYTILHLIESDVLGPRITGSAVGVHPAISIVVLVTGGQLFGVWGAALAVPVTGLFLVIAAALVEQWQRNERAEEVAVEGESAATVESTPGAASSLKLESAS